MPFGKISPGRAPSIYIYLAQSPILMRALLMLVGGAAALQLPVSRRALVAAASSVALPSVSNAMQPGWDPKRDFLVGPEKNAINDFEVIATQQAPPGKIDVNNALVTDYKTLQGMYPHAAGLIASNGPYNSVRDLNNIPGVTPNDLKLFAKYSDQFTALPPTRQFYERINARQST